MYISELKMHGFKSFADKQVMKLGQGITTVVGPNGCGKTNIVDAIRWVLGEQKYSVLRSGKMEDVIFNGAEGIKPLNVCQVSMTVHNNSGRLPIEYNDIEIARRVYRSGESEYYLNKTQCRLKDIMDLFVDTGMGADAYSVIELKMIEQILSETGDDRRNMFEEAAGIHKYRSQRRSTLRKFDATRGDLDRIKDIIAEVEQKVNSLALQLKRFKRHSTLTEDLESKEVQLAFLQVHRYQSIIAPLEARIKEYKQLRESKTFQASKYEKSLTDLQIKYKSEASELSIMQGQVSASSNNREKLRNKILVSSEQGRGALLTIDRLGRERTGNFQKIDTLKQLRLDFDKEMENIEPSIDGLLEKFKQEKVNFDDIEVVYKDKVKALDNIQNERWNLQRKLADDRSLYDRTKANTEERKNSLTNVKETIARTKKEKDDFISSSSILGQKKLKKELDLKNISNQLTELELKQKTLKEERNILSEEQYSVSAIIESLEGQHLFYTELVESKEGFPEGTRYVLENPKLFSGILGTVADMFQVDENYRDALESSLGDLSHCLIVKDKEVAISTLKIASDNQAGDLTIIPLKEAINIQSDLRPFPDIQIHGVRASDIVQTDKQFKPLSDYLLGNLMIVEDLSEALGVKALKGWSLVDKTGAYSGNDLILKSRQISEYGNLIGRKVKLENISNEILIMQKRKLKLIDFFKTKKDSISSNKKLRDDNLKKHQKYSEDLARIGSELMREQFILDQAKKTLIASENNFSQLKIELKESQKALKFLQPAIDSFEKKIHSFQDKVDKANNEMLDGRKQRDTFQRNLQETRIKLIELESRRDQIKFKKSSGDETKEELKRRQNKINDEIEEVKVRKKRLDTEIEKSEKDLEVLNAEIQKERSIFDLKQSVYKETYQDIEEIQARIASDQKNKEQILEDLKNAELEASKTDQKIIIVKERVMDRYNKKIPKDLIVNDSEEQLGIEIHKMQRSLENIGPVNMAVQDEFNEENERLEKLSLQSEDLLEAEENLRVTIQKIDKVARKRFQETFDLVKTNFETLFNLFFEGGNATLNLIGDPDPLEADIGIEAQPPGKRNSSLRLLSSGEKALTAISLLFAIYQVKPSPYCILDEVDAPLDDINIHKFTKVLSKFCNETQFIIVTHNKLTMEKANYMYGVTQEKKGVSKLVSVKFN